MSEQDLLLKRYEAACNYPGPLDVERVEANLKEYLRLLGIDKQVRRLNRGWELETEPALKDSIDKILANIKERQEV